METLFNSKILLDNISYLLNQENKKIGDLELETGVSKGYISRLHKKEDANPAIDFIMRTAKFFNIDINTLLYIRLSNLTPTEKYLNNFVAKMIKDTFEYKLDWKVDNADYLNHGETRDYQTPVHPLLELGSDKEDLRNTFYSDSFGAETIINDDCYELKIKNFTYVYLMNIARYNPKKDDKSDNDNIIELWIYSNSDGRKCLGTTKGNSLYERKLFDLYNAVKIDQQHIKLHEGTLYSIEAFMNDDLSDEFDEDNLPF